MLVCRRVTGSSKGMAASWASSSSAGTLSLMTWNSSPKVARINRVFSPLFSASPLPNAFSCSRKGGMELELSTSSR